MTLVSNNSLPPSLRTLFQEGVTRASMPFLYQTLFIFLLIFGLSGCSTYIASKQDNLTTQIDIWAADNEYGKAFKTLSYIKPSHPQYQELLKRKKTLQSEAKEYELKTINQILSLIKKKQWAQALDLFDQVQEKYPQSQGFNKTKQHVINKQKKQVAIFDQEIMLERVKWMIQARPIYQTRFDTDPRNEAFKTHLEGLNSESVVLAQKLTKLAQQAIDKGHFKTARTRIEQAMALEPDQERSKILASLKNKETKTFNKKKQAQKRTHKKQQNTLLQDIEKSFKSGNLIKTRKLISKLDKRERSNPELKQLEQELDRTINYTIQSYFSDANKLYTDGQFEQAIDLWEEVLKYDPENEIAKENIQRAEKVIDKLTTLREKQKE